MLDPITLDQLRMFIAIAEEGSFSAAARRLQRAQSAISHAMSNLESQLGLTLWDRSTRSATLTEQGRLLLASARRVCAEVDLLRSLSQGLVGGLEPSISLCVDAIVPPGALVQPCREFLQRFPTVELRVDTETMLGVSQRVLEGTSHIGVVASTGILPGLEARYLAAMRMVTVASREHPLAAAPGALSTEQLGQYVRLALIESTPYIPFDHAMPSPRTWRVRDLNTLHLLLRAGVGWGVLPEPLAQQELAEGRLLRLSVAACAMDESRLSLSLVHRADRVGGPAAQWLLQRLGELTRPYLEPPAHPPR